ncbi:MAG TPA: YdeI/OmpD-associated family protein [Rhodothermales bacterium]|nr:YdeI/OmpD-associated family protein [Rhodothermales bacterium]
MGTRDPRIDAYIERSADFARPVLRHLRETVHAVCPEVQEMMKWSFPHFDYRGMMMCSMAAFKAHCAFGFWKASLVLGDGTADGAMGQFGRITRLDELPAEDVLTGYIHAAMRLNDEGVRVRSRPTPPRPELPVPDDLARGLALNPAARVTFEAFPPSHRRDYVEWITGAKAEDTRQRRLETTLAWLAEGKTRNWKYERR